MIIHATTKTIERYGLAKDVEAFNASHKTLIERDRNDPMMQWGAKLFYFDRKKCIQLCHFESRFTLFLVNVHKQDIYDIGEWAAQYLLTLYQNDLLMENAINNMLGADPVQVFFTGIHDRKVIGYLNHTESGYLEDGYVLYDYIEKGILQTVQLNYDYNFTYVVPFQIDGKKQYLMPDERFRPLMMDTYCKSFNPYKYPRSL